MDVALRRVLWVVLLASCLTTPGTAHAAFPGDNGKIAFSSSRDDDTNIGRREIYTVNPDGTDPKRLTFTDSVNVDPAWSPDGTKIAYIGKLGQTHGLIVMNADGSGKVMLRPDLAPHVDGNPAWSPSGDKIIYEISNDAPNDLFVIDVSTGQETDLTDTGTNEFEFTPAWSPDGTRIAFSQFVPPCTDPPSNCNFEIFVMNADGTGKTRLTFESGSGVDADPNWSPDGRKLVWWGSDERSAREVKVMNADGSEQRGFSPNAYGFYPAWSPDGAQIAWTGFGLDRPSPASIQIMDADGSNQHSITSDFFDVEPDWQPILNHPPACSRVVATSDTLFPPTHRFVEVSVSGATDPDGDSVSLAIDGVTQDEPVMGTGDPTSPDALAGSSPNRVELRAELAPRGDGRVYRIEVTASDGRGGTCSKTVKVSVPRNKREAAVDSAPPSYNSFG